jgi:PKD repeat protein
MHRPSVCALAICVLLAVALLAAAAAAAPASLSVRYHFEAPALVRQAGADRVEMPGAMRWGPPGAPQLPHRTCSILLPPATEVAGVTVTGSGWADLPGAHVVEHGGQPVPIGKGDAARSPRDEALYASTDWYPAQPWTSWTVQRWRGHALLVLTLAPVRYLPAASRLQWQKDVTVTVALRPQVRALGPVTRVSTTPADLGYLRRHVDNAEAVDSLAAVPAAAGPPSPLLDPGTPYDYVIITNTAFAALTGANSLQDLAAQKTAAGTATAIVTTEWIYANYSGARPDGGTDDQTRIRNFIIDAYNTWGTHYVLLAGDADGADVGGESGDNIVPYRGLEVIAPGVAWDQDIPSDLYYGCLDGTFDFDADGRYGEPDDGPGGGDVDLLAEVHVGRAAVDQESEVRHFVAKTLAYDASVPPRDVLMVGEYVGFGGVGDWGGNYKDEVKNGSSHYGFTTMGFLNAPIHDAYDVSTLYDRDYPGHDWPASVLTSRINAGLHVINHLGHANTVTVMKLDASDADALTNTDYFIGYSQGCYAGAFDNRDYIPGSYLATDAIAEHLTLAAGGAVAFIANSRYGWAYMNSTDGPSQRLDRAFWDAVLAESIREIGAANDDSKWDNVGYIETDLIGRWCAYETNLFGDPQLRIRLGLSSAGLVLLDRPVYRLTDSATITVMDLDLDANASAADSVAVSVASTTESGGETVLCTETEASTGIFEGSIALAAGPAGVDGTLQVSDGDTIAVTYLDADDGAGGTNVTRTGTAMVDGQPPAFAGLAAATGGDGYVDLSWAAAADPSGPVSYDIYRAETPGAEDFGTPLGTTTGTAYRDDTVTPWVPYYYVVRAEDAVGNEDANTVECSATPLLLNVIYDFPLDSDPGWTAQGGWQFGAADVCGGDYPDLCPAPSGGWGPHTGSHLYGHRLTASTFPLAGTERLTTTALNCAGLEQVTLSFWRRLGLSPNTPASVQVSNDGASWTTAWAASGAVADPHWTKCTYDISAVADGQPTVYVRWSIGPTVNNGCYCWGFDIDDIQIKALALPLAAAFTASATNGPGPLPVTFTDQSTGAIQTWAWDFGDGGTSALRSPSHTYVSVGSFTVSLTVNDSHDSDTETKPGYITVTGLLPAADFSAAATLGYAPLEVAFTDLSTNGPTSWAWDFGDGNTSGAQSPTHIYAGAGAYTVSLMATNASGPDTETKADYIRVAAPAAADFSATPMMGTPPLTVAFSDQSAGTVESWAWDFGDGGTSAEQNPSHGYADLGSYDVSLTVTDPIGEDTETKAGFIEVVTPVAAGFSASTAAGVVPLAVAFSDLSAGGPTAWAWDFGDGTASTERNPSHTFSDPGYYTVTLTASKGEVGDVEEKPGCIAVGFTDTPVDHWAFYYILSCATANVVQGYSDNSYKPADPVTRAQMAAYIARALAGGDEAVPDPGLAESSFTDVGADHWAYRYVEYVKEQKVVQGYTDGSYQPDVVVDRGQMAVYIARSVATPTGEEGVPPVPIGAPATFSDVTADSEWAWCLKHVEYIAHLGVVQGYDGGTYHPEWAVTRDQMAVYVQRAFQLPIYLP